VGIIRWRSVEKGPSAGYWKGVEMGSKV